jgi:hypothetical protein
MPPNNYEWTFLISFPDRNAAGGHWFVGALDSIGETYTKARPGNGLGARPAAETSWALELEPYRLLAV